MPRFRQEDPIETPIENIPEGAEMMEESTLINEPKRRGRPKKEADIITEADSSAQAPSMQEITEVPVIENEILVEQEDGNTGVILENLSTPESLAPVQEDAPGMSIAHKSLENIQLIQHHAENIETEVPIQHLAAQPIEETVSTSTESLSIQNPLDLMPETTSFEMFSDEPGTKVERYLAEYRLLQNTEQGGDNLFWAAMQYRQDGLPGKARQLLQSFIRQYATHPKVPDAQKELYWLDVDTPSESQLFSYEDLNFNAPKTENIAMPGIDLGHIPATEVPSDFLPQTTMSNGGEDIFLPPPKTEANLTQSGSVLATEVPQPRYKPEKYDANEMRRQTEKRFSDLEKRSEGSDIWSRFSGNIIGIVVAAVISLLLIYAVVNFFKRNNMLGGATTANAVSAEPANPQDENVRLANPNDNYATLESKLKGEDLSNAPSYRQAPLQAKAAVNATNGGYGWQFKYTTRKFEADSLAYGLRQRGYRSGVIDGPEQFGKPGYRVVVGQFGSKDTAKENKDKLPFDAPSDIWVVDIK